MEEFLHYFQAILFKLQNWSKIIHGYIEELCNLQLPIMNMNGAKALNMFKQGLKYPI